MIFSTPDSSLSGPPLWVAGLPLGAFPRSGLVSPEGGQEDESTCCAGTIGMTFLSGFNSKTGPLLAPALSGPVLLFFDAMLLCFRCRLKCVGRRTVVVVVVVAVVGMG